MRWDERIELRAEHAAEQRAEAEMRKLRPKLLDACPEWLKRRQAMRRHVADRVAELFVSK
jgi:hypothetical protein